MSQDASSSVPLERVMAAFDSQVAKLQELVLIRGAPGPRAAEMAAIEQAVLVIEQQMHAIQLHIQREKEVISKATGFIELCSQQQRKIQHIADHLPARLPGKDVHVDDAVASNGNANGNSDSGSAAAATPARKLEKKGRGPPPRCYVTVDELASVSSYMRGRLTLDKVNAAVDEIATFAELNARLLAAPRNKLGDEALEKVLELRDVASSENVKGKHFFLETDMRGSILKLDNTGKSVLTILRHLGRIIEVRIGRQRAYAILKI